MAHVVMMLLSLLAAVPGAKPIRLSLTPPPPPPAYVAPAPPPARSSSAIPAWLRFDPNRAPARVLKSHRGHVLAHGHPRRCR
jgi:hypothetical protein